FSRNPCTPLSYGNGLLADAFMIATRVNQRRHYARWIITLSKKRHHHVLSPRNSRLVVWQISDRDAKCARQGRIDIARALNQIIEVAEQDTPKIFVGHMNGDLTYLSHRQQEPRSICEFVR